MHTLDIYQVDAFTSQLFGGNPAAVVPLTSWLPDAILQKIAAENNLAETAFFVKTETGYHIRWFTPTVEVALCGHATLATAYVIFHCLGQKAKVLSFDSMSGVLKVSQTDDLLTLDFPVDDLKPYYELQQINKQLNINAIEAVIGKTDLMLILASEQEVLQYQPALQAIATLPYRGVIITAPGQKVDFVSRFFGPASGIDEDPVTGSAHTTLTPYWAEKLSKTTLSARQLSSRVGQLTCTLSGNRVLISGNCVLYLTGKIMIP